MIKFFRHIRKSLLIENKTGKYFKYAIGEIVLVVIGILIALSLNKWNTQRIEGIKHSKIFENILLDIEKDIQKLSNTKATLDSRKLIFDKVRNDSITADLLDQGLSRNLTYGYTTVLNLTGVNQLKEITCKDS
ncbi:MAG: 3-dehydroquinate synthetase [Polaribacter sp.]|jgi:3-dehydroquinate synthetase